MQGAALIFKNARHELERVAQAVARAEGHVVDLCASELLVAVNLIEVDGRRRSVDVQGLKYFADRVQHKREGGGRLEGDTAIPQFEEALVLDIQ